MREPGRPRSADLGSWRERRCAPRCRSRERRRESGARPSGLPLPHRARGLVPASHRGSPRRGSSGAKPGSGSRLIRLPNFIRAWLARIPRAVWVWRAPSRRALGESSGCWSWAGSATRYRSAPHGSDEPLTRSGGSREMPRRARRPSLHKGSLGEEAEQDVSPVDVVSTARRLLRERDGRRVRLRGLAALCDDDRRTPPLQGCVGMTASRASVRSELERLST